MKKVLKIQFNCKFISSKERNVNREKQRTKRFRRFLTMRWLWLLMYKWLFTWTIYFLVLDFSFLSRSFTWSCFRVAFFYVASSGLRNYLNLWQWKTWGNISTKTEHFSLTILLKISPSRNISEFSFWYKFKCKKSFFAHRTHQECRNVLVVVSLDDLRSVRYGKRTALDQFCLPEMKENVGKFSFHDFFLKTSKQKSSGKIEQQLL